jgi:hypothetical protein
LTGGRKNLLFGEGIPNFLKVKQSIAGARKGQARLFKTIMYYEE